MGARSASTTSAIPMARRCSSSTASARRAWCAIPDDDIATQLGARIIAVDRPGIGISTRQANRRVTDWPRDVDELLDILGIGRCSIVAWSGGGPYALACGWQMPERYSVIGLISGPAPLSGVPGSAGYTWPRHRAMSRTADHAPWVIALAMWRWSRQQRSDPEKQLDDAIAGMIEADREILGDPALRAVMIANTTEMWRQGNRRRLRRGALPGPPLGLSHRRRLGARADLARRAGPGRARGHGPLHRAHRAGRRGDLLPRRRAPLRLRPLARDPGRHRGRGALAPDRCGETAPAGGQATVEHREDGRPAVATPRERESTLADRLARGESAATA